MSPHALQALDGPCTRFGFGDNWRGFLSLVDDERIAEARRSLRAMLAVDSLAGRSFLDVGSGSGLFSLAAAQLRAERVHSLDLDRHSVACTDELRRRYGDGGASWTVEQADVLDAEHMATLGRFDVVYAWGALHHTGDMFTAMDITARAVAPGGLLFVSIYNDQGRRSRLWRRVKRLYNLLPPPLRKPFVVAVMGPGELASAVRLTLKLTPSAYLRTWTDYKRSRGMSRWHDLVDWCGGYPFEVATPDLVVGFLRERGFSLVRLKADPDGLGCNEFVFVRPAAAVTQAPACGPASG